MPPARVEQSILCSECRVPFKDYIAYANHRTRKMKAGEGHIHCEICGTEFTRPETLDRHRKQEHAHEQDLDCPACGAHFVRLGGLMDHIERGYCKIRRDDIEHGRWVRSKMGRGLAELTGQDPKEYFGRFLGTRSDTLQSQSAVSSNKRLLGYIDTFADGASSVMGSKGKASEVSSIRGVAQYATTQNYHGPDLRFLDTTLFPTLAEASKKQVKRKGQADDLPTLVGVGDEDEPPLKPPKSLNDSIWAPKKVPNKSTQLKQSGGVLWGPNPGNSVPVKLGQDSNIGFPPISSDAWHAPVTESNKQNGSHSHAVQQTSAKTVEVVTDQRNVWTPQSRLTQAREAPVERAEQSEAATFVGTGASAEDHGRAIPPHLRGKFPLAEIKEYSQTMTVFGDDHPAQSIPLHIRGKIPGTDAPEYCQAPDASVDSQPVQSGDAPFHSRPELGMVLATAWADALKRENDTASIKHSDQGTIGKPIVSSRNSSGVPPHLRGKVGAIPRFVEEEIPTDKDGNAYLPPHLQREPGHAATIVSAATEANISPAVSVFDGQSTTKRTGSGSESEFDHRLRDNFGVVQAIKSYAVVAKGSGHVPPHLRVKLDVGPAPPTGQDANKVNDTQVEVTLAQPKDLAARQTGDGTDPPTQINTISDGMMEVEEEGTGLGPHDPDHPQFDARMYYEQYSRRYMCPVPSCGKLFKSLQGITGHLASDVHRRPEMRLQCPHCLRKFKTTTALTQHAESQGRRCDIRNTTEFRPFIDQLTSGIADVEGVFEDQTNRYVVTEEAVYRYGDDEIRGRAIRALEEHQRREIGEKEGDYWVGKEIAW